MWLPLEGRQLLKIYLYKRSYRSSLQCRCLLRPSRQSRACMAHQIIFAQPSPPNLLLGEVSSYKRSLQITIASHTASGIFLTNIPCKQLSAQLATSISCSNEGEFYKVLCRVRCSYNLPTQWASLQKFPADRSPPPGNLLLAHAYIARTMRPH